MARNGGLSLQAHHIRTPEFSHEILCRLANIAPSAAEKILARRVFYVAGQACGMLEYLRTPDPYAPGYQTACKLWENLAAADQRTSVESAMIYRYVQAHEVWRTHPDPAIDSAEALVGTLASANLVSANIAMGASTHLDKQCCIRLIGDIWGAKWIDDVIQAFPGSGWKTVHDCSRAVIVEIASIAKRGCPLSIAIASWKESHRRRNDFGLRRQLGIRARTTERVMLSDIRSTYSARPSQKFRATSSVK